jgi:energy-coupling factor transporter transmembrane protein EcfT
MAAFLTPIRRLMLYSGAILVFVAIIWVLLTPGFSIMAGPFFLALVGLLLMLLSVVVGWMVRHKRASLVVLVIAAILIIVLFQGQLFGTGYPVPPANAPMYVAFAQPVMDTSNANSGGAAPTWSVAIVDTGVVVFDIIVTNQGGVNTPTLSWVFDDSRSGMRWSSSGAGFPQSNLSAVKNIKVFYAVLGIVGGQATTFSLTPGASQQFHFEVYTKYPAGWAKAPQSSMGALKVVGAPSDVVNFTGAPTPPAALAA